MSKNIWQFAHHKKVQEANENVWMKRKKTVFHMQLTVVPLEVYRMTLSLGRIISLIY